MRLKPGDVLMAVRDSASRGMFIGDGLIVMSGEDDHSLTTKVWHNGDVKYIFTPDLKYLTDLKYLI
jgi:hypothetical protein